MITELGHSFDIQLFAGSGIEEKGISGVKEASAAGKQNKGEKITPDAGENTQAQRMEDFEALIRGEYREAYDAKVQHIVKQRLKGSEETVRKYRALSPALRILEKKYGVAEGDSEALVMALVEEESQRTSNTQLMARSQYESWLSQAAKLRETQPGFDLAAELSDERFRELLRSGVPMGDAYELIHRNELMEKTARDMEERISRRILSGLSRPRENGMGGVSSAVVKQDMSQMSKKTRQDIIRRVQKGERISF